MKKNISLSEAASYLGVSKNTLRNWDNEKILVAHRHPDNNYRTYDLDEIKGLKKDRGDVLINNSNDSNGLNKLKALVSKLHNIVRDTYSESNIIERFDEITKILFVKLSGGNDALFSSLSSVNENAFYKRFCEAYKKICEENNLLIPRKFSFVKCSPKTVYECAKIVSEIKITSANYDLKGVLYEEIIKGTFEKNDNQQFFTPAQVTSFLTEMMVPFTKGIVCDPACGTGGFLIEIDAGSCSKILGFEIDERLSWISAINLKLHNTTNYEIYHLTGAGSLDEQANEFFNSVDMIITNPPFGSDVTDAKTLGQFKLGKGRTNRRRGVLFIEQCWNLLKNGGYLGIVLDEGIFNLSTTSDVRDFILKHFEIISVVSLPVTTFMPYATVNSSILVLKKVTSPVLSQKVFYAKAEKVGRKNNGDEDVVYIDSGAVLNSDLPPILEKWKDFISGIVVDESENYFVADVSENLKIFKGDRLDFTYHHPSRNKSQELMDDAAYPMIKLSDVCDERNISVIPAKEMGDEEILYTGLANIDSYTGICYQLPTASNGLKSAVKRYEPGDILFSKMRPELRKIAVASFVQGGYASHECSVLTVKKNSNGQYLIDPVLLSVILRSDFVAGQIMHLVSGIGRPRIGLKDLRSIQIPIPDIEHQLNMKTNYLQKMQSVQKMKKEAEDIISQARKLEHDTINDLAEMFIVGVSING